MVWIMGNCIPNEPMGIISSKYHLNHVSNMGQWDRFKVSHKTSYHKILQKSRTRANAC